MNTSIQPLQLNQHQQALEVSLRRKTSSCAGRLLGGPSVVLTLLAGLFMLLFSAPSVRAQGIPPGCTGSAIGISLFTSAPDVHIGDTLTYSVSVFNGLVGNPTSCDASNIVAWITTPDGIVHPIALRRTYLSHAQSDFYTNIVSYVVRAQDIRSDGTVRTTAEDTAIIYQNDTPSTGGANQGVNTEVSQPCIQLIVQCIPSVGANGAIIFNGAITNCGNNTLVGVTVTNYVNGGAFAVLFPTNILRGQSVPFTGSYVPANPCLPSTATLVAIGVDQFTSNPRTVISTNLTTCSAVITRGIQVTKTCPIGPTAPGELLVFSGSVSNTGNISVTNVVVMNNQPAPNTQVFARATLAPGEVATFSASYVAPTNCSVTDTLTATATGSCGVPVTSTISATCPIVTTPGIAVTEICPATPGVSGGSSSFSGVVRNTGNITLNNVVVVSDRPAANTVVFTAASLAPGASANYSGNFTVPLNVCNVTTGVRASGNDSCTGAGVTNTASVTCPITTAPAIAVTLACPVVSSTNGGPITYTGTVRNSGNVTLNNIVVTDSQSSPTTVLTVPSLAPGVSANFTASFTAPMNVCSVSSTVNASASDNCSLVVVSNSASATCTLATNPRLIVTQTCPVSPVSPGGVLTYSGSVSNAGNIALTNIVVTNDRSGVTPVFTAALLLPGGITNFTGSYTVPVGTDCSITSILSARGNDTCSGSVVNHAATSTCPIAGTPLVNITLNCPATPVVTGNSITFSGTVSNPGNVPLINVTVVNAQASPSTVLTLASLAPGASANFTATFASPVNACSVSSTVTARGSNTCAGVVATANASATCALLTAPAIVVRQSCPVIPVSAGSVLAYSGSVSNAGNLTLTNVVVINSQTGVNPIYTALALIPGAVSNFTGSYTVPVGTLCSVSSTATATGREICSGNTLTNTATATCTLATAPSIAVTLNCPGGATTPGGVITYTGTVRNSGNITLNNVTVVNSQSSPSTVLTVASLAPGVSTNFTASFTTALDACAVTSGVIARGTDACTSAVVTNSASATCAISGTPQIAVTLNCPVTPVVTGNSITFSGTVSNPGNVPLINVSVVNAQATPSTVLTLASLAAGASANFTATFASPANACSVSSTVTARGSNTCAGVVATANASANCTLLTAPAIVVRQSCPVTPVSAGSVLAYSGSVSNAGNLTLTNVVVINSQTGTNTIYAALTLIPGAISNFTGSYTVPAGTLCSVSSIATATGREICSGNTLTNSATATCTLATAPSIAVILNCPTGATAPGGVITYNGTVRNSGNITLNNVTVVNSQASPSTVLTLASLAPGISANFTASFTAALDACGVSSSVIARGTDACSASTVTNTASATCPLVTTPGLVVTQTCPTSVGGVLTYSGSVSNAGNISLTNVIVRNDRSGSTIVFATATLAPGARTNFTGSYTALSDVCSVVSTVTATAADKCTGISIAATATVTCPLPTNPRIVVTQTCPLIQVSPGDTLTYSGTVSNAGNATLTGVVVTSDRTGAAIVFSIPSLAPRATANFTGSYVTHDDCCVDTSTLTASGRDCNNTVARDSATRTCALLTAPAIVVTKVCPTDRWPLAPGDRLTYSGVVSNSGTITLTNVTVVSSVPTNGVRVFGPITLAAGESADYTASFIIPVDFCGTDTVTARGVNLCTMQPVTNSVTTTCPITMTPAITVTKNCPALPTPPGALFAFTGSVSNSGNVTLLNVFVVNDQPAPNTPLLGPITLAPGATRNFAGSYPAPTDCCEITDTVTASGQDRCAGIVVADTATQVCPVFSTPSLRVSIACPATPVLAGGFFEFTGLVTNTSTEVLVDVYVVSSLPVPNTVLAGPIELAPGESEFFTGGYTVVAGASAFVVSASGLDLCQGRTITAAANCSGPVTPPNQPRAITVTIAGNGTVGGVANGQLLNIGQSYTATATPAAGSSFVNWSGGVSGTSPSLTFVMRSNLVVQANFVFNGTNGGGTNTGGFVPVAGVFNGLFYLPSEVQNQNSGAFTFKLAAAGTYTASVQTAGKKHSAKGKLSSDGKATNTIVRSGTTPLTVTWAVQPDDTDRITGTVTDGEWLAGLTGDRAIFNATNLAPQAGRYTLIIPGTPDTSDSPAGDGYGTATVNGNGQVSFKGTLADGTKVTQKVTISKHGQWPMYVSRYAGRGSLLGWLQFTNRLTDDISGPLSWIRPAIPTSKLYPAGFGVDSDAVGSRYTAPVSGTSRVLEITNGVVIFRDGNLSGTSTNDVTMDLNSKVTNVGPNPLTLSFTLSSGLFKGTFIEAGTTRKLTFNGAVLQKANLGSGFCRGTNENGHVSFQAAP